MAFGETFYNNILINSNQQQLRVFYGVRLCVEIKNHERLGVIKILGITVILIDAACGKKESVHTVHYLLPALLYFSWHSI